MPVAGLRAALHRARGKDGTGPSPGGDDEEKEGRRLTRRRSGIPAAITRQTEQQTDREFGAAEIRRQAKRGGETQFREGW